MSVMFGLWENWYVESIAWIEYVTWSTMKTAFDSGFSILLFTISHYPFEYMFYFFFRFKNRSWWEMHVRNDYDWRWASHWAMGIKNSPKIGFFLLRNNHAFALKWICQDKSTQIHIWTAYHTHTIQNRSTHTTTKQPTQPIRILYNIQLYKYTVMCHAQFTTRTVILVFIAKQ